MRVVVFLALFLMGTEFAFAAKKVTSPDTSAANDQVDLTASITLDESEIAQKLGADPGNGVVLLYVKITPKVDKPIQISPDDFVLLSHDDGERAKPFEPAELAGQGALVVKDTAQSHGSKGSLSAGLGGMLGGGGSSPGNSKEVVLGSKMDEKSKGNDKLLDALRAKELPTKESVEPVDGYLYFPLSGKHKLKNLVVLYRGPAGKLDLEFQH